MSYTLIVPPIAETAATGFRGGAEKKHRGALWRCELWAAGWSITRAGTKVRSWDDVPKPVQKAARDARCVIEQAEAATTARQKESA